MWKYDRLVLTDFLKIYIVNAIVLTSVFIMEKIFEIMELLITKGIELQMVLQMIYYFMPAFMMFSLPLAFFISFLLVFTKKAEDQEIIALVSMGLHPLRLYRQVAIAGVLLFMLMVWFNYEAAPKSNYQAREILLQILKKNPTYTVRSGVFVDLLSAYRLMARDVNKKNGLMDDVFLYDYSDPKTVKTIRAKSGVLMYDSKLDQFSFRLFDGVLLQSDPLMKNKTIMTEFKEYMVALKNSTQTIRNEDKDERTMTLHELRVEYTATLVKMDLLTTRLAELEKEYEINVDSRSVIENEIYSITMQRKSHSMKALLYLTEIHKKPSLATAILFYSLIGFALGIFIRKRQKSYAYTVGMAIFFFYYMFFMFGQNMAERAIIPVALAMWMPNLFLLIIALYLFVLLLRGKFYLTPTFVRNLWLRAQALNQRIIGEVAETATKESAK